MDLYTILEPLRGLSNWAATFDWVTKFLVFALAAAIFVISLLAYRKTKEKRFLLVAGAFFIFAAKWFLKIFDMFFSPGLFLPDSSENVFEFVSFLLLLVALFKK